MATNLPSCFSIEFSEQLLKFLVNFTLLKYVKFQRSYGFLITKELIFGFRILDLKDHFSASLTVLIILWGLVSAIVYDDDNLDDADCDLGLAEGEVLHVVCCVLLAVSVLEHWSLAWQKLPFG